MYFQFLTEDKSTEVLVGQIMSKLKEAYPQKELFYDIKSFHGIGHLKKQGNAQQQKTGMLLNDLFPIMRGMGKADRGANEPYGERIAKLSFLHGKFGKEDRDCVGGACSMSVDSHMPRWGN